MAGGERRSDLFQAGMPAVIANVLGLPAVTIPISDFERGMPIGVPIVGRPFADELLLEIAIRLEEARGAWRGSSNSIDGLKNLACSGMRRADLGRQPRRFSLRVFAGRPAERVAAGHGSHRLPQHRRDLHRGADRIAQ